MKLYVWDYANHVTNRYHNDGAVLILAGTLLEAAMLWREYGEEHGIENYTQCECLTKQPDHIFPIDEAAFVHERPTAPRVIVHQDAGCC